MSVKLYSFEEVSKHNSREDLWMIIDGKVYDITKFQDEVKKNIIIASTFFCSSLSTSILVVKKF
jgi:hypothetical protein